MSRAGRARPFAASIVVVPALVGVATPVGLARAVVVVVIIVVVTVTLVRLLLHQAGRAACLALVVLPGVGRPGGAGADRLVLGVEALVVLELVVADHVIRRGRVDEDAIQAVLPRLVV